MLAAALHLAQDVRRGGTAILRGPLIGPRRQLSRLLFPGPSFAALEPLPDAATFLVNQLPNIQKLADAVSTPIVLRSTRPSAEWAWSTCRRERE